MGLLDADSAASIAFEMAEARSLAARQRHLGPGVRAVVGRQQGLEGEAAPDVRGEAEAARDAEAAAEPVR